MTWFALVALTFVAIALLWVLPPLLRRHDSGADVRSAASNLAIIKDQLAELERDLGSGTLSPQQYQQAREDLERRALEEARETGDPNIRQPRTARRSALVLALTLPVFAVLLYLQVGSPDALQWRTAASEDKNVMAQDLEAMAARLAARLESKPQDINGWALLGRSYMVMQRYQDSAAAYARAVALVNDNAELLADYADALAMSEGGRINGTALQIANQALQIDPMQWKALAMAGSAAFERKDYKAAVGYWEKLRQRPDLDPEFIRTVEANIAEAQQLGGIKAKVAATPKPVTAGVVVQGTVSLSPALSGKADPSDTLFIFARATQGPRMPLAIIRRQVKDLPYSFSLDDSQAMTPEMKLSNFTEVVVSARVSKSANAVPQGGDFQGNSKTVKVGATNVAVTIDSVIP